MARANASLTMPTRRLRIRGRVQGVGYRDALCQQAQRLGVAGWVRNRSDGSVEALLHGEPQAVEALTAWAQAGPPAARVVELTVEPGVHEAPPSPGFVRRPTA
jgi:acylphosphatase